MTSVKSLKIGLISLGFAVISLGFSITAYAFMVEAVKITSVLGYNDSVILYCVVGIIGGILSFILMITTVIVGIKALESHIEQRKYGKASKLCVLLIVLCFLVLLAVVSLAFSALFGSIGLLG